MKYTYIIFALILFNATGLTQETSSRNGIDERQEAVQIVLVARDEAQLSANVTGKILKINFKRGDAFKKDELLVKIDDTVYAVNKNKAEANLTLAKANLKSLQDLINKRVKEKDAKAAIVAAKADLKRAKELIKNGAKLKNAEAVLAAARVSLDAMADLYRRSEATQVEYENAKRDLIAAISIRDEIKINQPAEVVFAERALISAKSNLIEVLANEAPDLASAINDIAQAENALTIANKEITECIINAPYNGRVISVEVNEHELVQPGQPLIKIIDDSVLQAHFLLPESLFQVAKIGTEVKMSITANNEEITGKISRISADFDAASGTFEVYVDIDNKEGKLNTGMKGWLSLKEFYQK